MNTIRISSGVTRFERCHDLYCAETRVIYAREVRRTSKVNTYHDSSRTICILEPSGMIETIRVADLADRWPEIALALRTGEREFMVIDGQTTALIVDSEHYHRLAEIARREERRRRVLNLPLTGETSATCWDASFVTLTQISENFAGLSDDDLDVLFGTALSELHAVEA